MWQAYFVERSTEVECAKGIANTYITPSLYKESTLWLGWLKCYHNTSKLGKCFWERRLTLQDVYCILLACQVTSSEGLGDAWRQLDMWVEVRGGVLDHCNSQTSCWSALSVPNNELHWRCLSNVTVSSSWTRYYKKDLKILHQALLPSRLEVRTALERGYITPW